METEDSQIRRAQRESDKLKIEQVISTSYEITLGIGLFSIELDTNSGLRHGTLLQPTLIHPTPDTNGNVVIVSESGNGWLGSEGQDVIVRVRRTTSTILWTSYQRGSEAASLPRLKVTRLDEPTLCAEKGSSEPNRHSPKSERYNYLVHQQGVGDIKGVFGTWVGKCGSRNWIEGISIEKLTDFDPDDLMYRVVYLGQAFAPPEVPSGTFSGSRGIELPIAGFVVKLSNRATTHFKLEYYGSFLDGSIKGPFLDGQECRNEGSDPLDAIKIILVRRDV